MPDVTNEEKSNEAAPAMVSADDLRLREVALSLAGSHSMGGNTSSTMSRAARYLTFLQTGKNDAESGDAS